MYYANNYSALTDGNYPVNYYWTASPSAFDVNFAFYVHYAGFIYDINTSTDSRFRYGGLRPVVCLTSNISLK